MIAQKCNPKPEVRVVKMKSICENCANFMYEDETDSYYCSVNMDEDDYVRFITSKTESCPYFNFYDEYSIVRKQN